MFLLCTYVDGERWTSAFEPLLYPTGVNFYRPFSYRESYFQPIQAAQQLTDPAQRDALLKQPTWNWGFFGIRFLSDEAYTSRFIPLRKITLTDVRSADVLNLRFRLGNFVSPLLDQNKWRFPSFDLSAAISNLKETKLFIDAPQTMVETAKKLDTLEEFPARFWQCFEQELSPAAWERVRNVFLLRLSAVRRRGKRSNLAPDEIDSSARIYGYSLRVDHAYDLAVSHYRIIEKGKETPGTEYQFVVSNPPEEIASSKRMFQLLGNYRDDDLWIKPRIPTEGPIELAFESTRLDQPNAFVDATSSKMIGLKVPVSFEAKGWTTMRWVNLLLFLFSLVVSAFLGFREYVRVNDQTQKILLVIIAALISLAINSFKDFVSAKE